MSFYIVCHRKRNNPRMDVRVCRHKCPDKKDCEAYISSHETGPDTKHAPLVVKPRSVEMGVA